MNYSALVHELESLANLSRVVLHFQLVQAATTLDEVGEGASDAQVKQHVHVDRVLEVVTEADYISVFAKLLMNLYFA